MTIQEMLNDLVDRKVASTIKNASLGWATILRYEPLVNSNPRYFIDNPDKCYVFEIGRNCGDVFSANLVKSINITDHGAEITLKS